MSNLTSAAAIGPSPSRFSISLTTPPPLRDAMPIHPPPSPPGAPMRPQAKTPLTHTRKPAHPQLNPDPSLHPDPSLP